MQRILFFGLLGCMAAGLLLQSVFAQEMHSGHHHKMAVLHEAGTDPFATIQEVIRKLEADPATDWSKVNLEALRRHLVDMHHMTLYVAVDSQTAIPGGAEFLVRPETEKAVSALDRMFAAHPAQLKREYGWAMTATREGPGYRIRVTGKDTDAAKISGLGYIGILAVGKHHQHHHWMLATGADPHHH